MKTIEIIVDPKGKIEIDAIGFKGSSCKDATKEIERALGMVEYSKKKPEYNQTVKGGTNVRCN